MNKGLIFFIEALSSAALAHREVESVYLVVPEADLSVFVAASPV